MHVLTVLPSLELECYGKLSKGLYLVTITSLGITSDGRRLRVCSLSSHKSCGPTTKCMHHGQCVAWAVDRKDVDIDGWCWF